jgi:hypothetical protein
MAAPALLARIRTPQICFADRYLLMRFDIAKKQEASRASTRLLFSAIFWFVT